MSNITYTSVVIKSIVVSYSYERILVEKLSVIIYTINNIIYNSCQILYIQELLYILYYEYILVWLVLKFFTYL